ncbi:hypothetical protein HKX48_008709 [Thoreauomyces humboldtii]|nr:hypothetical protein HKX48_008709 [Thoreauomyces humboldtii]
MHPLHQKVRKQLPGIIRRQKLKKIMPSFAPDATLGRAGGKGSLATGDGLAPSLPATINWPKIFESFHSKLFSRSFDRHAAIFDRLCIIHATGVPLHDLTNVADFLMVVKARLAAEANADDAAAEDPVERLRPPLCRYLTVLRHPFDGHDGGKGVAQLTHDLKLFTRIVGDLVNIGDASITGCAVEILFKLAGGPKTESPISIHRIVTYPWLLDAVNAPPSMLAAEQDQGGRDSRDTQMELLRILSDSNVVENLTVALRQSSSNAQSFAHHNAILRAFRRLSVCEVCIAQMLEEKTFAYLLDGLRISSNASIDLSIVIETLWNAIEGPYEKQVAEALSTNEAIGMLTRHLTLSHPPDLLTDVLIVCTDISRVHPDNTTWTDEGILERIWDLLKRPHPAGTNGRADTGDAYALQKELLTFLKGFCAGGGEILEWCLEKGMLDYLLEFLRYDSDNPSINCWSIRQLKGLQLQILTVLQEVLPHTPFQLHTHPTLHTTLLSFLKDALEHDTPTPAPANDEHPNPTSDYVGLVSSVLRTLVIVCERDVESSVLVGESGGFALLIDILRSNPPLHRPAPLTSMTLLTTLLGPRRNRDRFASTPSAVSTLLMHLSLEPLAALHALWATLPASTDAVLVNDGVQRVLDVLVTEREWSLLSVGLGFLCDLVESNGVAWVMKEWKDESGASVVRWLIALWTGVELELGDLEGEDADEKECRNPLTCAVMSKPRAFFERHVTEIQDDFTEDIEEMGWNLRAKIYSLLHHLHPVDTTELLPAEEIKLIMIDSYPTFKHHALLRTLSRSLYNANVRPTSPDQEVLDMAETVLREKKRFVNAQQMRVVERQQARQKADEEEFWKEVQWVVSLKDKKPQKTLPPLPKTPEGKIRVKKGSVRSL